MIGSPGSWSIMNKKNLIYLVRKESPVSIWPLLAVSAISGTATAALLAVINNAISLSGKGRLTIRTFLIFITIFVLFIYSKQYVLKNSIDRIESIIDAIRRRLSDKIRHSELLTIEKMGKEEIYSILTKEINLISGGVPMILESAQATVLVFFLMIYILILSRIAFVITLFLTVSACLIYLRKHREIMSEMEETNRKEMELFRSLTHMIQGFKEVRSHSLRSDSVFRHACGVSAEVRALKVTVMGRFMENYIFSQAFFYGLLGVLVFILPQYSKTYSEVLFKAIAAILFMIGPLSSIVGAVPQWTTINFSVAKMYGLEETLDKADKYPDQINESYRPKIDGFTALKAVSASFHYEDENGNPTFGIGPIDLSIPRGETLFVVGGNGSGKTTLLKMLSGLYMPRSGGLQVDETPVSVSCIANYRNLFSMIFTEYHLFDRLYGLEGADREKVLEYLKMMQLDRKTSYHEGAFTDLELSTGQRKRLAMIIALLENRPVYIFDEWACDQDPEFRKYFYHGIIKDLKKAGKTLIVASHDDAYFNVADRIIKLDYGRIVS